MLPSLFVLKQSAYRLIKIPNYYSVLVFSMVSNYMIIQKKYSPNELIIKDVKFEKPISSIL